MELSIIILNYKVPAHLLLCVDSVIKALAEIDAEIIVADNNSQDKSLELLTNHFPDVKQIPITENLGFSKGNNKAIQHAKGKYICLLNPDTVVPENVFKDALAFAKKKTYLGVLGVQLIDGRGAFLPESKRNIPLPKVAIAKLLGFHNSYYANQINKDETGKVPILVGAFMLMQLKYYHQVGGLDDAYFMYGEDIDLSFQFLQDGFSNYYMGNISCLHFKGESTIRDQAFRDRFFGAMQLFYKKHFKVNWFLLKLVSLGLNIAQRLNIGVSISVKNQPKFQQSWLVSNNKNLLEKIPAEMNCELIGVTKIDQLKNQNGILIFDAAYLSYREIIEKMTNLTNNNFKFRIIPKTHNLMLGSDSSKQKGDVFYF